MIDIPKLVMNDKERALRAAQSKTVRPRLSSTIVLLQGSKDNPHILMGQRSKRHDFMPSVYVFPGGRVDRSDSYAPYTGQLSARTETILESVYSPRRARATVLAAIRETYEETSLLLGTPTDKLAKQMKDPSWQAFADAELEPDLTGIEVFGRAITPPHRHKRFDTWFFVKHLDADTPPPIADSAELLNVNWFSFDEIEKLEQARATVMMMQVLKQYLSYDIAPRSIFFSRMVHGTFKTEHFP